MSARCSNPGWARQFDVSSRRTVARFAVDAQAVEPRVETTNGIVPRRCDLAPVTILAVGTITHRAQHAMRRPIREIRFQGNLAADGHPVEVRAQLHKPHVLLADEIERQEAHRAIRMPVEERLRAAANHVPTAHHSIDRNIKRRRTVHLHTKRRHTSRRVRRNHDSILELQRNAIEARDNLHGSRHAASLAVSGRFPFLELFLMTTRTTFGANKILEARSRMAIPCCQ